MGTVFRATDMLTRTTVALKRVTAAPEDMSFASKPDLHTDHRVALAVEFRTLSSLRHPHIISVLDYGFDDTRQPYFTMEYLPEAMPLTVSKSQPFNDRIRMILEILQALVYLHRRGILHRDLKPGNVLLVNGHIKVVDFGLSVLATTLSGNYQTETTAGTFAYMAPELFAGAPISKASDLYSVGILAYELLVGRHPFNTQNMALLFNDILNKKADVSALGVDDPVAAVLQRLLVKDADRRYSDAWEVIVDLCEATNMLVPAETTAIRESFLQAAQFVGRDHEMQQLSQILDAALAGHGDTWLIGGESGVGKSRLLDELRTLAQVKGALVLHGQSVREDGATYQVWRNVFPLLILHAALNDSDASHLKPYVPDIQELLGREIAAPPPLNAEQAQNALFRVVAAMLHQPQTVVVILEDLQWAGSESLALLNFLATLAANVPLLLIGNYRDDDAPQLPDKLPNYKTLKLHRLPKDDVKKLSVSMLGEMGADSGVMSLLERETEGNVFFVVEVVRALAEYAGQLDQIGRVDLPLRILPGGVQQVVQRRLKQVPEAAYSLLQLAAIVGRDLDLQVLQVLDSAVSIETWLHVCSNASVLEVQGNRWRFTHDKLREHLLDELPESKRGQKYRQVAEAIEAVYSEAHEQYRALAHLWNVAGDVDKEFHYAKLAGQQELKSNAYVEGIRFLERALELLLNRESGNERADEELQLQLLLGPALMNYYGYSHPSVASTYERAAKLGRETQQVGTVFQVLWGLWATSVFRGDYEPAQMVVQQMSDTAKRTGESIHRLEACHVGWSTAIWLGETRRAEDYFLEGIAQYEQDSHRQASILISGHDTGTCAYSLGSINVWLLGYPDLASQRAREAERHAKEANHPYTGNHGYLGLAMLGVFTRDITLLEGRSEAFVAHSYKNNSLFFMPLASIIHGWYLARIGRFHEAVLQLENAVTIMHTAKIFVYRPLVVSLYMDVYLMAGRLEEGVQLFREELEHFPLTGERIMESEIHRIYGEILVRQNDQHQAEESFQLALHVARQQEAKSLELRAGVSLAHLWRLQGRQQEAYALLTDICQFFTEGFDSADLEDVNALLQQLMIS